MGDDVPQGGQREGGPPRNDLGETKKEEFMRCTSQLCRLCPNPLMFGQRSIGSDLCGPCWRWTTGTQNRVDWHYRWLDREWNVMDAVVADEGEG